MAALSTPPVIYHCPFCGEEDLEPVGDEGGWECHSCTRSFVVLKAPAGPPSDR